MKHIYDLFGKYLTKFSIVDLDKKFCSLLKEDSIVFDDKAKEMISDEIAKQITFEYSKDKTFYYNYTSKSITKNSRNLKRCFSLTQCQLSSISLSNTNLNTNI